ncbi:MAG: terminase small subunit [Alphaproteobacteria bacterium]
MTTKTQKKAITPKQEMFCQNVVSGMNNLEAYRAVFSNNQSDKTARNNAYRLTQLDHIKNRIEELNKKIETKLIKELAYSKEESFRNFEKVQELALEKTYFDKPAPDLNNFIKAEELKGKLFGLYNLDKSNIPAVDFNINLKQSVSQEDLEKMTALIIKEINE